MLSYSEYVRNVQERLRNGEICERVRAAISNKNVMNGHKRWIMIINDSSLCNNSGMSFSRTTKHGLRLSNRCSTLILKDVSFYGTQSETLQAVFGLLKV